MLKAAVVGASGYAGAELVRLLSGHPEVKLTVATSRQYAGMDFKTIYPALTGFVDLVCVENQMDRVCDEADVVFLALPHKIPMAFAPELLDAGKKVIDLSADFRFKNLSAYEAHYQPHTSSHLLEKAVYGLCEVYREKIINADLIGNPGCYPTSTLIPLYPLLKEKLIDADSIIVDSKSGVSGAGRSANQTTHYCHVNESFKAYKVASHRHMPEMEENLSHAAGRQVAISFTPHLIPMTRGMETTTYAGLEKGTTEEVIGDCLKTYYNDRFFVRILPEGQFPDTLNVRGTNFIDINFKIDTHTNRLILMSVIDNLVKGAAGQAVQNMNLMYGLDETLGLDSVPYPI